MVLSTLQRAGSDNMKLFLCALSVAIMVPLAAADPLDELIPAYEAHVKSASPEAAAGDHDKTPHQWSDVSLQAVSGYAEEARALLEKVQNAETDRVIDQAILERLLQSELMDADYDTARIPFTGDWGFQAQPIFAAMRETITTVPAGQAWIDRLNDTQRYFEQNVANMRRGIETGWTANADPLGTVMAQIREQIVEDPVESGLYAPFLSLPDDMPEADRARLQADGLVAVSHAIDAYRETLDFLETEYAPEARDGAGIADLPGGRDAYAAAVEHYTAGAGYDAETIHALGNEEVQRIRAEMEAIIAEIGYEGSFDEFLTYLRTDPQFYAETPEQLMAAAEEVSARLRAILPDYFSHLPELDFNVEPVPASIAPGYTTGRYVSGEPKEGRKGTYLVNTYALDQRPLYELPSLSAHEAVPGHHLQITLAQEMTDQPEFRKNYYATAFGEGWGLYSERIAGEAGIYRTPYERFGALSYEMWRACRLVADTGLHWYGWSREEAEACFIENSALSPLNIQTEVTRYIGWPGQAVAYKVGELKIRELRAYAEENLGPKFDIRAFHDVVLGEGAVPLDVLDWRVKTWVSGQVESAEPAAETSQD
ncbi:hypothetical protein HY3_07890 [Hyphomonas pacifica]|uniref:Uncharacterized protein n=2 Tax=Hyphomonas pacifica TaxID=1280941 RepID=A0A062U393_9PROT|nr:hypothetical protein HY2_12725 [Hyphomonas pacifica]RAN35453.1 hypothetical protein HY3_07890 [Hyphomonas pacifica]